MPASIGVNLRVTGHCSQGGRKYMEDLFSVAYQQTEDERDLEYAFFGIYDGHGGSEAAAFAKEHLMDSIVKQRQFWSDNDEDVLKAIRNGYMLTHLNMWKELEKWPKTVTGLPSTAGTTASIAFIRRGKIYIGHVGDSAIVLGYQKDGCEEWAAKPLTSDHKPESTTEIERIQRCGGKVVSKAGVPRVVWNRPRLGHKGPIKKNTLMDEIPFLAVARSLGDLWSYNPQNDEFIVSPDPDVGVLTIDPSKFRCLIFGTDGLWNMISPEGAVSLVQATERHNEAALVGGNGNQPRDWLNPSKSLVDHALERWSNTRMRADNTSVVTLMLDPPGPPRATVLRSRSSGQRAPTAAAAPAPPSPRASPRASPEPRAVPQNGLTIMTRYSDAAAAPPLPPCATLDARLPAPPAAPDPDDDAMLNYGNPAESYFMARLLNRTRVVNTLSAVHDEISGNPAPREPSEPRDLPPGPATVVPDVDAESDASTADRPPLPPRAAAAEPTASTVEHTNTTDDDGGIQINEVSSSSPTEGPLKPRGRRPRGDARRDTPAAAPDRVLRSHQEAEPPQRPHTRQHTRAKPSPAPVPPPCPAPPLDRVVILTRRAPPAPVPPPPPRTDRLAAGDAKPAGRRITPAPAEPAPADDDTKRNVPRATRSQGTPGVTPLAQKITRSIGLYARELRGAAAAAAAAAGARAGNSARAPGPARRTPAARRPPPDRSKENLGAARGRARARAAPAASPPPRPRTRRADSAHDAEVHSTTQEPPPPSACVGAPAPPAPVRPRALRSRNDAASPVLRARDAACKRSRCGEDGGGASKAARLAEGGGAGKVARLAPERCARALGRRATGPWAPALALRNRLRRRLAK
ncbi:nascent polypeptide-associated complex subunit alpha, muscle-specific form-like [Helicoverpa zea]|nr:nascent polypeptide-associated complex subunit alpha, muscle-specific form-like [Helicoverpa zea]